MPAVSKVFRFWQFAVLTGVEALLSLVSPFTAWKFFSTLFSFFSFFGGNCVVLVIGMLEGVLYCTAEVLGAVGSWG